MQTLAMRQYEFTAGGQTYVATRLTPEQQIGVMRRLGPTLLAIFREQGKDFTKLKSMLEKARAAAEARAAGAGEAATDNPLGVGFGEAIVAIEPLVNALAAMDEEAANTIIVTTAGGLLRKLDTGGSIAIRHKEEFDPRLTGFDVLVLAGNVIAREVQTSLARLTSATSPFAQ